jgi:hypothetical protein
VSGTGRGFETAPLRKHKRYAQCRADKGGTRALAHLLAAPIQPHIQSKQKSQPFPPATKDETVTVDFKSNFPWRQRFRLHRQIVTRGILNKSFCV